MSKTIKLFIIETYKGELVKIFDSHCHITDQRFDPDREEVINSANKMGVEFLTCGTCLKTSRECVKVAEKFSNVFASVGIHPNHTGEVNDIDTEYSMLKELTKSSKVVAIGETGLDWYWDSVAEDTQKEHFKMHLELAKELKLPVVVHARDSAEDCLDMLEPYIGSGINFVWHCFVCGKKKLDSLMHRAIDMDIYLGISGIVTFQEQVPLRKIIPFIPDKHLLLDTDSPYLIPKPRTVERNEPAQALRIAEEIALLRGVTTEDIARITTRNAYTFLNLDIHENSKIAYPIRDSLYLNLTNQCTNDCVFCARNKGFVVKGHDISLAKEPSAEEVIEAMGDFRKYSEVVFCGYGEPTMKLEVLMKVAQYIKSKGKPVRLNTNGLANLYYERNIVPELASCIDEVSISLNSTDPDEYLKLCRSRFGEAAYPAMLEFAKLCHTEGIKTTLSVVDMPGIDVAAAKKIADDLGVEFRARSFVDAG